MSPQTPKPDLPLFADLLSRAMAGLFKGLMPGARPKALIDRLEGAK